MNKSLKKTKTLNKSKKKPSVDKKYIKDINNAIDNLEKRFRYLKLPKEK